MKHPIAFYFLWLATCLSVSGAGTWNGVAFTAWNGAAITAWNGTGIGVGGGASYLVNQNFEGTGYDNSESWTESTTGTIDEDSTSSPLVGSQSLNTSYNGSTFGTTYIAFTANDSVYGFMRIRVNSVSGTNYIITFRNGTSERGFVGITSGGKLRALASGGSLNESTNNVPTSSDLRLWFEYSKSTGANDATMKAGWSTDATKPTLTAGGTTTCVSSNGTSTQQINRLYLGDSGGFLNHSIDHDKVLVDDAAIGNEP